MRTVYQHLTHFSQPRLQTYVVRILWMVPIYAVESWFSLRFKHASIYIQAAREWYASAAARVASPDAPDRPAPQLRGSVCQQHSVAPPPLRSSRPCPTAYVIYNFLYFLIAYLGDEDEVSGGLGSCLACAGALTCIVAPRAQLARKLMAKPESKARHLWPMNYILSRWELGR